MILTVLKSMLHFFCAILLGASLGATPVHAQSLKDDLSEHEQSTDTGSGSKPANNKEKANENLTKITSLLQGINHLQADFEQIKHIKILQQPLKSQGRFVYFSSQGVIWELLRPYKLSYLLSNNSIKQFNGDTVTTVDNKQQPIIGVLSKIFGAIFSGDIQVIKRYFTTDPQWLEDNWQLILVPENKLVSKLVKRIHLAGSQYINKMTIWEAGGDEIEFVFSNYNAEVNRDEFRQYFNF